MVEKIVYTVEEIAEMLTMSKSTVYTMVREGELQGVKVRGGTRILKTSLEEYLQKNIIKKAA